MKRLCQALILCHLFSFVTGPVLAQNDKAGRDKKENEKKNDAPRTPEFAAFQKQLESLPTERLKQMLASEQASLEQWCRKNNFNPPGRDDRTKADRNGKGRNGGTGKGRGKVVISKRQEAELMTQYAPWKAKIDLIEQTLREREKPTKEDRPKKNK